jgi:hypothetical protein
MLLNLEHLFSKVHNRLIVFIALQEFNCCGDNSYPRFFQNGIPLRDIGAAD